MRIQEKKLSVIYAWIFIFSSCGLGSGSGSGEGSRTKPKSTDASADGSAADGANSSSASTTGGTVKSGNGVGAGGTTNVADPNFLTNFNSQPSSFYIIGQQVTQVTTSLDATYGSKCTKAEIGNFKAFKSSTAARLAVCIPVYSNTIGGDSLTSDHMLSLDNPIWSNPNLSKGTFVGFFMTKDAEANSWEILIIGGDSTNSEKSVEAKYISVPKRNSLAGTASNMGFYAYYATSGVWGTAPETRSWPTTGNNSIAVSANFGVLSHTMMAGALPSIKATIGSVVREIKSIPLP